MSMNKIFSAPKSLELENFLFNPIAVINACSTVYLIHRDEHELKVMRDGEYFINKIVAVYLVVNLVRMTFSRLHYFTSVK